MPGFFDYLQPEQNTGMFGGISNWLGNNSNALIGLGAGIARGGTINDIASNAITGFGSGRQNDIKLQQQNAMFQGLVSSGLTPQQAMLAILNPEFGKGAVPSIFPKYEFPNVDNTVVRTNAATGSAVPVLGIPKTIKTGPGEDLNTVTPAPVTPPGALIPTQVPTTSPPYPTSAPAPYTGAQPVSPPPMRPADVTATSQYSQPALPKDQGRVTTIKSTPPLPKEIDTGTEILLTNPLTGEVIKRIPKDVQGRVAAEKKGEIGGQAAVALPDAVAKAASALDIIERIKTHPSKLRAIGVESLLPSLPGSGSYDFDSLVNQAKSQSFLQAFESLKGAGQITEVEGAKATQAITRLSTGLSPQEFDRALNDLESVVRAGIGRAKLKAAYGGGAAPSAPQPPPGYVIQQ